jgi:8-oxo-dGTP pyrophosphatase MutT (NUDIX family)
VAKLDLLPYDEYVAQLPGKSLSAGVVIRDAVGRILLLKPSYKRLWDIPGGVVEIGEPPWETAVREVREEIGRDPQRGRLLVVDYVYPQNDTLPERVGFVFDGGRVDQDELPGLDLGPEIVSARLFAVEEIRANATTLLADRLAAAITAARLGLTVLCENGKQVV